MANPETSATLEDLTVLCPMETAGPPSRKEFKNYQKMLHSVLHSSMRALPWKPAALAHSGLIQCPSGVCPDVEHEGE